MNIETAATAHRVTPRSMTRTICALAAASLLVGCAAVDGEEATPDESEEAFPDNQAGNLSTFGTEWCIYPDWNSQVGRWCSHTVNKLVLFPRELNDRASMISVRCGKLTTRATLFVYEGSRSTAEIGSVGCQKGGNVINYAPVQKNDMASSGKVFAY